jgi:hypothetical protein
LQRTSDYVQAAQNDAHPAAAEDFEDLIMRQQAQPARCVAPIEKAERFAGDRRIATRRRRFLRAEIDGWLNGRAFQKSAGAVMGLKQRLDPRASHAAVGARFLQMSLPVSRVLRSTLQKDLFCIGLP